jgi:hypothetical protein
MADTRAPAPPSPAGFGGTSHPPRQATKPPRRKPLHRRKARPVPKPTLLRVPTHFRSVADVLGAAAQMDLPHVLVLSERDDGALVFLDSGLNMAECNWLIDRLKALILAPQQPMRPSDAGGAA